MTLALAPFPAPLPRRVAILVNPLAGTGPSGRLVDELLESLRVLDFPTIVCRRREELSDLVARERESLRCIVSAGGDGTLAEVLNRAPGVPVALLPLGNENLVAQHFQVPRSGKLLAETIAAGHVSRFDLARANARCFSLMASAGIDAEVVYRVHRGRRGHINRFTYALHILRTLHRYAYPPIEVEIEETGERLTGAQVFLFNLPRYALGLPIVPQARPDDGRLNLCVFRRPGIFNLARYAAAVVRRRQERFPDIVHREVERIRLWSEQKVRLQIDGDPAGRLPVTIDVVRAAFPLMLSGRVS